ncbi:ribonuclease pancreatic-like [Talpa occidentalis]|uniref:ribonuclease pancreatic-like n=1 Tax=Talpa occidentalis TaxID=50954 RepID=UPI00188ED799|nr:ribonuclease pancreatic-like [Talpa occidentalis]
MALKSLVLFSLMVLVLLVLAGARPSWPKFENDHMDPGNGPFSPNYCNKEMENRNISGKLFNTFVHQPVEAVQAVCLEPNITCKNGQNNCHKSRSPMSITECIREKGPSDYNTINKRRHIVIACEGNPLLPVHYDGSEEVSSEAR